MAARKRVLIESPYAGDVAENLRYLHIAMRDSIFHYDEAPIASHELYTRALNDLVPEERAIGIAAGLRWGEAAELTAVYLDRGISNGMRLGIEAAEKAGRPIEWRSLPESHHLRSKSWSFERISVDSWACRECGVGTNRPELGCPRRCGLAG